MTGSTRRRSSDALLRLIAVFTLAKGVLLLLAGAAVFGLVDRDIADTVGAWSRHLHLDPEGRLVRALLRHTDGVDGRRLLEIGAGMFIYAALLLTEGVGLLFRARWAEYFTVVITASLVPLELYEIARHLTLARVTVLAVNVAIVWYLIVRLRREPGGRVIGSPP